MWCEGECGVGDDGVDEGSVAVTPVTAGRLTCALHSPTSDTRALRRQKNKKKGKTKTHKIQPNMKTQTKTKTLPHDDKTPSAGVQRCAVA